MSEAFGAAQSPTPPADSCAARLDQLGWQVERSVEQYGYAVRFRSNTPEGLAWAERVLLPGMAESGRRDEDTLYSIWAPRGESRLREQVLIYRNGGLLVRTGDPETAVARLEDDLHQSLALHARERIFIHCGVVSVEGRALLIPGASFSGKSTLVAALVRAGATYYSDEYAVIDPQGRVEPFARLLRLRDGVRPPEAARPEAGLEPIRPGWVLFTRFEKASGWYPNSVSPGQTAIKLLAHTVAARLRPAEALRAVRQIAEQATCWETPRGEADPTAQRIVRALLRGAPDE